MPGIGRVLFIDGAAAMAGGVGSASSSVYFAIDPVEQPLGVR
ncbi:hypothetical protein [Streptomyces actuosus]|nr:hypothetical protein [Streptomyces actuosus]